KRAPVSKERQKSRPQAAPEQRAHGRPGGLRATKWSALDRNRLGPLTTLRTEPENGKDMNSDYPHDMGEQQCKIRLDSELSVHWVAREGAHIQGHEHERVRARGKEVERQLRPPAKTEFVLSLVQHTSKECANGC